MRDTDATIAIAVMAVVFIAFVAWVTHVMWAISTVALSTGATVGQVVLAVIGAAMPPVGAIHGFMIWFGI